MALPVKWFDGLSENNFLGICYMLFVTYLQAVCELSTRSEKEDYKYTETNWIGM